MAAEVGGRTFSVLVGVAAVIVRDAVLIYLLTMLGVTIAAVLIR